MSKSIWVGEEHKITLENYQDIAPYTTKDNYIAETLNVLDNNKIETIKNIFKLEKEINKNKQDLSSLKEKLKVIDDLSKVIFNERTIKQ